MYISDEAVLQMERTRAKLEQKLRDRGIYVTDGEDINSLINKVDKIGINDILRSFILNTIEEYEDDEITKIGISGIYNKKSLKKLILPNLKIIENSGIYSCENLEEVFVPNLEIVNSYGLRQLGVKELILPKLINAYGEVFNGNSKMKRCIAPIAYGNLFYSFNSCSVLEIVDFDRMSINLNAFVNCYLLKTIILRNKITLSTLSSVSSFTNSPFHTNGVGGRCYVPQNLVEDYKVATNWSSCNVTFIPLEGTIYEDLDWYNKEEFMITVDNEDYYLPIDTTVAQFKATFLVNNLYSNDMELTDDALLSDYKDMQLSSTVGNEVTE